MVEGDNILDGSIDVLHDVIVVKLYRPYEKSFQSTVFKIGLRIN